MNKTLFAEAFDFFIIMADAQTDLKPDLLSSKARRGFHCKLMWSHLQHPYLRNDRALINQGNHKEVWERHCRKSHWDHKCIASINASVHNTCLSCYPYSYYFLFCSSFSPQFSFQTFPRRHWSYHYLNCTKWFSHFKCLKVFWMIVPSFKRNSVTGKKNPFISKGLTCTIIGCGSPQSLVGLVIPL